MEITFKHGHFIVYANELIQYVVLFRNAHRLSSIEPCFVFDHPNPAVGTPEGVDNTRYM